MKPDDFLVKSIEAQEETYDAAFNEIASGEKRTHWMWFVFPQINGLGQSEVSKYYAIRNLDNATAFLEHPILGSRLIEISRVLLSLHDLSAEEIFGFPDNMKLKSSMTLFAQVEDANSVFQYVLNKYFDGRFDEKTLHIING